MIKQSSRRYVLAGVTFTEIMVVLAIALILAGILFPVITRARVEGAKTTCLSNLHQLGLGINLYASDFDDHTPGTSSFQLDNGRSLAIGFGWAGKIYDRVKSKDVFRCPSDPTSVNATYAPAGASVVSYGINSNLASKLTLSQAPSAPQTVLLFEVVGNSALVTSPDEGASARPHLWTLRSPTGNGTTGSLAEAGSISPLPGDGILTVYATGIADNAWQDGVGDDFKGQGPRHAEGANYLAYDGHAAWAVPKSVSAGANALSSTGLQSPTGCKPYDWVRRNVFPCAEGTAVGKHKLTYSAI